MKFIIKSTAPMEGLEKYLQMVDDQMYIQKKVHLAWTITNPEPGLTVVDVPAMPYGKGIQGRATRRLLEMQFRIALGGKGTTVKLEP